METLKNVVAVLAGIIGLGTGLLTLYAKYLDVKKSAAGEAPIPQEPTVYSTPAGSHEIAPGLEWIEEHQRPPFEDAPQPRRTSPEMVGRSRDVVRPPAVALIAFGLISLFFNLFIAGFGYVDRFVTPLTEETQNQRAMIEAARANGGPLPAGNPDGLSDDATVVMTICVMLSLAVGSAAAAWGGFGMLRLRGYWLSVAGSIAIMGGGSTCCLVGIPIGVWSLVILFRPDVAASFKGS